MADQRYIEIDGRRWRRSDPAIPETLESELVSELMSARRAVKSAQDDRDDKALQTARDRVHDAKLALGERGHPWWETPDEAAMLERLTASIRALLRKRGEDKTICPSDAARVAGGEDWRGSMHLARQAARRLAEDGWLDILKNGTPTQDFDSGPVRLKRKP